VWTKGCLKSRNTKSRSSSSTSLYSSSIFVIKNPGNYPCVFLNFCKYNYPGEKGGRRKILKILGEGGLLEKKKDYRRRSIRRRS